VFVVEDADGGRDIVSRILRRASYEVHAAADPAGALRLVRAGPRFAKPRNGEGPVQGPGLRFLRFGVTDGT